MKSLRTAAALSNTLSLPVRGAWVEIKSACPMI